MSYPPLHPSDVGPDVPTWAPAVVPGVLSTRLQASLVDAVRQVPQRPGGGYVAADLTTQGVQVSAGQRLSARWAVGGWVGMTRGQAEGGVRVTGQW